jgi:hypothetical protein
MPRISSARKPDKRLGQLEGEVAAMAMGKIYTFGPSFRAENSNTPRHLASFGISNPRLRSPNFRYYRACGKYG